MKDDSGSIRSMSRSKVHQHLKCQPPKVMDIISRLPGSAGQAADAVSVYTQVEMEDAPTSLMDICHLKNSELEPKFQKYKGRVVLRGDIVKDDSGLYAVFTEQGSSASQMTVAKVMDVVSRLPGCARQAADANTQVKMGMSRILDSPPKHKWPKSWSSMEDPVVPLERNLYGHLLAGRLQERQFERAV